MVITFAMGQEKSTLFYKVKRVTKIDKGLCVSSHVSLLCSLKNRRNVSRYATIKRNLERQSRYTVHK